jgi:guanylate kinase
MGRLVILSGPSCIGKGSLHAALTRFHPELSVGMEKLVLYNSREPRPGEVDGRDYHFRSRARVEAYRGRANFLVMDVRGDLQALDVAELKRRVGQTDVFFEGNAYIGSALLKIQSVDRLGIFLSPLSGEELDYLSDGERDVDLEALVTDVMRRKLLRRTQRQKGILSLKDLENVERRARSALCEMREAWKFDYVIANHDGEDSENWDAFYYPVGDARRALNAFVDIIKGYPSSASERWAQGAPL